MKKEGDEKLNLWVLKILFCFNVCRHCFSFFFNCNTIFGIIICLGILTFICLEEKIRKCLINSIHIFLKEK